MLTVEHGAASTKQQLVRELGLARMTLRRVVDGLVDDERLIRR